MAEKVKREKKEAHESKTVKIMKQEPVIKVKKTEELSEQETKKGQVTSLELLWQHTLQELDVWDERADFSDEVFLKAAQNYTESIKRNQAGFRAITEQFTKEIAEWEKTAREEFLMSTTTLQHFFPVRSYEELNQMFEDFQNRTFSLLNEPFRTVSSNEAIDVYVEMVEQFIDFRKNSRLQYAQSVKETANVIYENQKVFLNLFSQQMKAVLFPFDKYLEKTED